MADMDSAGSRNRQAPATVRRNTAPARPTRVVRQPRSKVLTSGPKRSTPRRTSNPPRKEALRRRTSNNSSSSRNTRSSAPRKPAPQTSKTIVPPAPPKPAPPPGNATWLRGDSVYQRQLAAYSKALADFQADQGLARTDYETNYQNTFRDIGLAKGDAQEALKNDYASRGMLQSSLYNEGLGELNSQYQNQYNDLAKQRTGFLDQLAQEFVKYKNEQGSQQQNAMDEALRRRAEKYNL